MSIEARPGRRQQLLIPLLLMVIGILGTWLPFFRQAMLALEDGPLSGIVQYLPWGMMTMAVAGSVWAVWIIGHTDPDL